MYIPMAAMAFALQIMLHRTHAHMIGRLMPQSHSDFKAVLRPEQ